MKKFFFFFPFLLLTSLFFYFSLSVTADFQEDILPKKLINTNQSPSNGMVSSASKYATDAGIEILKQGGNAIDAAAAIAFTLAVTYPQAGNIGGGGFMVIRTADNKVTTIDFREKAPLSSSRDMYLDASGNVIENKSLIGHLSAGVPGSVAGLLYASEKYGRLSRQSILKPAIQLAENGFIIEEKFAGSLNSNESTFKKYNSTAKIFTKKGGFKTGEVFIQKDLASVLKLISEKGRDGFYSGNVAELIVKEMSKNGGLITLKDLSDYKPVERVPLTTNYKGYDVYSMGPPSSGGIALITMLNMVENEQVPDKGNSKQYTDYVHILIETMKRAYSDRAEYLGDPDYYKVPVFELTSKKYAKEKRNEITSTAGISKDIKPGLFSYYKESDQTTHFSVIDKDGNMVSVTTTLNNTYGSYVVVDGAGFLMNDEMDDFSVKPGTPNMFGLIGNEANSIQPGKRMLSSMTPTIVLKDNKPFVIIGSPGGGRIITTVFLTLLNIIDFNMPLNEAIDLPRFHHQLFPEYIQYEHNAMNKEIIEGLISKGHSFKEVSDYGQVNGILVDWNNHIYYGHSDRRGYGKAEGY